MLKEGVIGINRAPPMGWRATSSGSPGMQDQCQKRATRFDRKPREAVVFGQVYILSQPQRNAK